MAYVIYKDGSREPLTKELLEYGSELQKQNVPLSYLRKAVSLKKEYKGTIGVTSLMNGARYNFFRYHYEPDVVLDEQAFKVMGTDVHAVLEEYAADKDDAEEKLRDGRVVGISDLLEKEPADGWLKAFWKRANGVPKKEEKNFLTDYKTSGSYKVAKCIGIVEGPKKPALDENGEPVLYKRAGKWGKVGDQKMEKTYIHDLKKADNWEYAMQLNQYRKMYEAQGITIHEMRNFFIVRDGGTQVAYGRGVMDRTYMHPVERIPDEQLDAFFQVRAERIHEMMTKAQEVITEKGIEGIIAQAQEAGIFPEMCDNRENWDGRRCQAYCPFSKACALVGDNKYLEAK
jgi:hypothetical protein